MKHSVVPAGWTSSGWDRMPEQPLTLIQLLPALEGGGVERATLEVAAEALERGHHAIVVSAGGRLSRPLKALGATHIDWPIGRKTPLSLRWVRPLRRLFAASENTLVHARSRLPAWLAYRALCGLPQARRPRWITTVHGLYSVNRYSAIMTRGDAVIAVSKTVRDYILQNYPRTEARRVHLIYNGLEPAEFPYAYRPSSDWLARWQREFPQTCQRRVLTLPGRLTRRKGHEDFIQLLARLKSRSPITALPVYGLIVGGAVGREPYLQELRDLCARLGLIENVDISFTGQRADVREIYTISDLVFSLSTKPESFGRTVLEALSLGVPVVAYDHGGVGEILTAMFPSGKVPLGDQATLQQRVEDLLQARPTVAECSPFSRRTMLDVTFRLYQQLAGSNLTELP